MVSLACQIMVVVLIALLTITLTTKDLKSLKKRIYILCVIFAMLIPIYYGVALKILTLMLNE